MKIKDGFVVRRIVDELLVVPVGERVSDFNGLISINETGADLWEALQNDITEEQLVEVLLEKYEIDEKTAAADVSTFLSKLSEHSLIID